MTDYTELVKALRCKRDDCEGCDISFFDKDEGWMCQYAAKDNDAADAIEALEARLGEAENSVERWKDMYLTKHEPKRGKWIIHPEVKNIYGGECIECPFCGEKYVVQYIADEKFCRNCGAYMRAKMEVQE